MSNEGYAYRLNIRNLSDKQLQSFRDAYKKMMDIPDKRGYNHWAGMHGYPEDMCVHGERSTWMNFRMKLFLPWHRAYLYMFEQALKDQTNGKIGIPWWDWTSEISMREGMPKAFTDEKTPNGENNPLYSAKIPYEPIPNFQTRRREPPLSGQVLKESVIERFIRDHELPYVEKSTTSIPGGSLEERLMELGDFGDFSDKLQTIHGWIHGYVGGNMGNTTFAAYDPIFWSHHSMVDRIWRKWQLKHGLGIPNELEDVKLEPFPFSVKEVLNVHMLGYDYASSETEIKNNNKENEDE